MSATFTPFASLLGGMMLSASTSSLLISYGNVLGISGIAHSVSSDLISSAASPSSLQKKNQQRPSTSSGTGLGWKAACFAGLLVGGWVVKSWRLPLEALTGAPLFDGPSSGASGWSKLGLAGFLVGLGSKLGSGCTSGHMLCGLARLSKRSLVASMTFFITALVTAQIFPSAPSLSSATPLHSTLLTSTPPSLLTTIALLQIPFLIYNCAPRLLPPHPARLISSFSLGIHFAFGLTLAGMVRPSKVLGFFHLPFSFLPLAQSRTWDPSLLMVVVGGLLPNLGVWQSVKEWKKPLWNDKWELPTRRDVDWKLVGGSWLFGLGWGLSGLCPGPAFTTLGAGLPGLAPFCLSFIAGGVLGNMA